MVVGPDTLMAWILFYEKLSQLHIQIQPTTVFKPLSHTGKTRSIYWQYIDTYAQWNQK